ncbi:MULTISPECIES: alpha/beta fold hydrolase [Nostocales]|uniref:Alpha/beta hydrolase n=3 Tax=Nostocales TaxID=1161 RepID=A0A0C1R469_9CYAN|nr:alpha/beta hydrolase [Tolypothrix bouteillei]KAF3889473.1 alpha/beta hydrolase [Tolypothrix bouteillei VB521301]
MPQFQTNGLELFYQIQGTGEPLLLISGFLCDHTYWSLLMPSLTKQYQVIRLDNRGMGRSSTSQCAYSIKHMATDAAALIEHLGLDKVHVAGHSMGGQIAQELALAQPEKVCSLLLLSSLAKGDDRFNAIIETWGDLARILDLELYEKVILPWIFTNTFYSTPGAIETIIQMVLNYPFPPVPQELYYQSRAITSSDIRFRLSHIHCPTLVLVSRQDVLTPVKFSEELLQGIPNAELVVLDSGGHGFIIESPETVAQSMCNFLAKVS